MNFNDYQQQAKATAMYPGCGEGILTYPALKLAGEAGEVSEKVGKRMRKDGTLTCHAGQFSEIEAMLLAHELGDVLWYISALAGELGYDLDSIASMNLEKLAARQRRDTIDGEGDIR